MQRNRGGRWQRTAAVGRNRLAQQKQVKRAFAQSRARNEGRRLDENINDAEAIDGVDVPVRCSCGKVQLVTRDDLQAGDVFCSTCSAPLDEGDIVADDDSLDAGDATELLIGAARRMTEKMRRPRHGEKVVRQFRDGEPTL